jgi:hypothetical protein
VKLVPTFEDGSCHVVSVTDRYSRILGFLDRKHSYHCPINASWGIEGFRKLTHQTWALLSPTAELTCSFIEVCIVTKRGFPNKIKFDGADWLGPVIVWPYKGQYRATSTIWVMRSTDCSGRSTIFTAAPWGHSAICPPPSWASPITKLSRGLNPGQSKNTWADLPSASVSLCTAEATKVSTNFPEKRGRSVGIVCSRTQTTEFSLVLGFVCVYIPSSVQNKLTGRFS